MAEQMILVDVNIKCEEMQFSRVHPQEIEVPVHRLLSTMSLD